MNLYGYVGGDPVNYFDPTGKVREWAEGVNFWWTDRTYNGQTAKEACYASFGADGCRLQRDKNRNLYAWTEDIGRGRMRVTDPTEREIVEKGGDAAVLAAEAAAGRPGASLLLKSFGGYKIVASAARKIKRLAKKFKMSPRKIIEYTLKGRKYSDRKTGNFNFFRSRPDGKSGYLRITVSPDGKRIISAGVVRARGVESGIRRGRFTLQ